MPVLFQVLTTSDLSPVPAIADTAITLRVWAVENACAISVALNIVGEKIVGEKMVGLKIVGEKMVGLKIVGEKIVGLKIVGEKMVGLKIVGEKMRRAEDRRAVRIRD